MQCSQSHIAKVARRQWRKESGAHQQARAENSMLRYKRVVGEVPCLRKVGTQTRETAMAVNVLNRMTGLGRRDSVAVVA